MAKNDSRCRSESYSLVCAPDLCQLLGKGCFLQDMHAAANLIVRKFTVYYLFANDRVIGLFPLFFGG
jgi:hypothetical protein